MDQPASVDGGDVGPDHLEDLGRRGGGGDGEHGGALAVAVATHGGHQDLDPAAVERLQRPRQRAGAPRRQPRAEAHRADGHRHLGLPPPGGGGGGAAHRAVRLQHGHRVLQHLHPLGRRIHDLLLARRLRAPSTEETTSVRNREGDSNLYMNKEVILRHDAPGVGAGVANEEAGPSRAGQGRD